MPHDNIDLRDVISEILLGLGQRCATCQSIDFYEITRAAKGRFENDIFITLGSMAEIVNRKDICSFCRLIYGVTARVCGSFYLYPHYQGSDGKHRICALMTDGGLAYTNDHGELVRSERTLVLDFAPKLPAAQRYWRTGQIPLPRIIGTNESEESSLNCARELRTDWADIQLAKSWMKNCELWHDDCKIGAWNEVPEWRANLRVIDVNHQCLTRASGNCRYIALSYCWGKSQGPKLTNNKLASWETEGAFHSLQLSLPKTLRDAIYLVNQIGERYLWIDALCLMQDNLEELQMFAAMDKIYSHAVFTIVAADGEDANNGLPGVHEVARSVHPIIAQVTPNIRLSLAWPDLDPILSISAWNQRAWTYQERLMSRRMLIFLHGQMYWACHAESWNESRILEHQHHSRWKGKQNRFKRSDIEKRHRAGLENKRTSLFGRRMIRTRGLQMYFGTVEEYTFRKLTFEKDILNAFAGLSAGHCTDMKSSIHFGLPLRFLDMAMLWYRTVIPLRQRCYGPCWPQTYASHEDDISFPSWSWAAWIGPVRFLSTHIPGPYRDPEEEHVRSVIQWYRFVHCNESISTLLDSGIAVPVLPTDRLERIVQAHEDDTNPTETPPEEIGPYDPLRDWRVEQGEDVDGNTMYPLDELMIAFHAAALWRRRNGGKGDTYLTRTDDPIQNAGPDDIQITLSDAPIETQNIHELARSRMRIRMADGREISDVEQRIEKDVFPETLPDYPSAVGTREEIEWFNAHISKRDFRYLYFRTSCAFFHLGHHVSRCRNEDGIYPRFEILHPVTETGDWPSGEIIGWVQLHSNVNPCMLNRRIHEFVIISEAHKYGEDNHQWAFRRIFMGDESCAGGDAEIDWKLDEEWMHFRLWNVLLIEWKDEVAYRIGIGRVWKKAWSASKSRLKLITLG